MALAWLRLPALGVFEQTRSFVACPSVCVCLTLSQARMRSSQLRRGFRRTQQEAGEAALCQCGVSAARFAGAVSASFRTYTFTVLLWVINNSAEDTLRQCGSFASKLVISNILKHGLGDGANISHQEELRGFGREHGARLESWYLSEFLRESQRERVPRRASCAGAAVGGSCSCRFCRESTRKQLDRRASPRGAWHDITPAPPPVPLKGSRHDTVRGQPEPLELGVLIDVFGGPERGGERPSRSVRLAGGITIA